MQRDSRYQHYHSNRTFARTWPENRRKSTWGVCILQEHAVDRHVKIKRRAPYANLPNLFSYLSSHRSMSQVSETGARCFAGNKDRKADHTHHSIGRTQTLHRFGTFTVQYMVILCKNWTCHQHPPLLGDREFLSLSFRQLRKDRVRELCWSQSSWIFLPKYRNSSMLPVIWLSPTCEKLMQNNDQKCPSATIDPSAWTTSHQLFVSSTGRPERVAWTHPDYTQKPCCHLIPTLNLWKPSKQEILL